jgi:hypothetical protein
MRVALPDVGYRVLGPLAEADVVRSLWSRNFDALAARAAAPFELAPIEGIPVWKFGSGSVHALPRGARTPALDFSGLPGGVGPPSNGPVMRSRIGQTVFRFIGQIDCSRK